MDSHVTHDLRRLISEQSAPCVSIYMPTHVAGENGQQDPVRLKNLLQRAEERLSDTWLRPAEARRMLQAARELPADPIFWENRDQGLALFIGRETLRAYRLPLSFDERIMVGRRYHLRPLLPMLDRGDRFFVLALSQNRVRFLIGSRYSIEHVPVEGLPANMKDALNYSGVAGGAQAHSAMQGSLGKQAAVFHGQGGQADTRKEDIAAYFRIIDTALQPLLRDEKTPLLLAGVEYLLPIYREITNYGYVIQQELAGNCDHLTVHQLHQRVWPLIEPEFARARKDAAQRYCRLLGTDRTSDDIRQIVPAAHGGRVDTLFVDVHAYQWGFYDPHTVSLDLDQDTPSDAEDLLDLAAVETLSHRGTVYSVPSEQVPSGKSMAALFRY